MATTVALPRDLIGPVPMLKGLRFELLKLASQWRIRLVVLLCWVAPAIFVAAVSGQSVLPTDTVFGRWMHATGWAGSLIPHRWSHSRASSAIRRTVLSPRRAPDKTVIMTLPRDQRR